MLKLDKCQLNKFFILFLSYLRYLLTKRYFKLRCSYTCWCFSSWKKKKQETQVTGLQLEEDYRGKTQPATNSIRNSPKSHSAIKTKASARPSGAIKTFCFVLPVRKICLKINYKRKENRYLCSHFHHDGTPLVRTSNTAFCTARQS